ncbi:MAG: hypothetical protein JJ992_12095, partial [Planctomycetes bacterium]|nr:hypothetical protein [Planctomycetota bacterium]
MQVHRTKPLLGRRQELRLLLLVGADRAVAGTLGNQAASVYEILRVVDAEVSAMVLGRESIGSIDSLAARGREIAVG